MADRIGIGLSKKDQTKYNNIISMYYRIMKTLSNLGDKFSPSQPYIIHRDRFGYCLGLIDVVKGITGLYKKYGVNSIFEVMCGCGALRILLHRFLTYYGRKYECSDLYHKNDEYGTVISDLYDIFPDVPQPTRSSSTNTIKSISEPNSAVLISFAPYNKSDGADSLKAILENPNVNFVISLHDRSCVANAEYYEILDTKFEVVKKYGLCYIALMEYEMVIYKKM